MNRPKLSILPSQRFDAASGLPILDKAGFVDDEVVLALVTGSALPRQLADSGELVLSADDMDFAGWRLSAALPARSFESAQSPLDVPARRPSPPLLEDGIGEPHRGSHRWWIAGLAGALSTLLFSVLLLTLSSRTSTGSEEVSLIRFSNKPKPAPVLNADSHKGATELTGVISEK